MRRRTGSQKAAALTGALLTTGALVVSGALTGCGPLPNVVLGWDDDGESTSAEASPSPTDRATKAATGGLRQVDGLGVAFALPDGFEDYASPDFDYSSRRIEPRGLITVLAGAVPDGDYPLRPGEVVSELTVDGLAVTQVLNSAIQGLSPGVEANTLIVSNGDRSFSLIMSGVPDGLDEAWKVLMATLTIEAT